MMTKQSYILNGPNLNLLGQREPSIYGSDTLASIEEKCRNRALGLGVKIEIRQSNHEGVLVDWIHEARAAKAGVLLNPGAYNLTSIALHDAIKGVGPLPLVEVHLSNVRALEAYLHKPTVAPVAVGMIC